MKHPVQQLREDRGLGPGAACVEIGISRPTLWRIENWRGRASNAVIDLVISWSSSRMLDGTQVEVLTPNDFTEKLAENAQIFSEEFRTLLGLPPIIDGHSHDHGEDSVSCTETQYEERGAA